jgi:hypothetical protein
MTVITYFETQKKRLLYNPWRIIDVIEGVAALRLRSSLIPLERFKEIWDSITDTFFPSFSINSHCHGPMCPKTKI